MALTPAQTAEVKRILATGDKTKAQDAYKNFDSYNASKNSVNASKENVDTASLAPINQGVLDNAWNGGGVARPSSTPVAVTGKPVANAPVVPASEVPMTGIRKKNVPTARTSALNVPNKSAAQALKPSTQVPVSKPAAFETKSVSSMPVNAPKSLPKTETFANPNPTQQFGTKANVPVAPVSVSVTPVTGDTFNAGMLNPKQRKEVAVLMKTDKAAAQTLALKYANERNQSQANVKATNAASAKATTAPTVTVPTDKALDGTPAEAPVSAPLTVSDFTPDTTVTLEDIKRDTGKDLREITPQRISEIQSNIHKMVTEDPTLLQDRQKFDRMVSYIKKTPDEDQAVNYMYDRLKTNKLVKGTDLTDTEAAKLQYAAENRAKGIKIEESNYENTKSTLQDNLKSRLDLYDKQTNDLKSNLDKQLKDNEAQIDSFRSNMYQQLGGRAAAISRIVSPNGQYLGDEQMIAMMGEAGVKGMQSIVDFKNKVIEKNNELINKAQQDIFKIQEAGQISAEEAKKALSLAEYTRDLNNQRITESYYNNIFGVTSGAETREEKVPELVSAYAKSLSLTPEQQQYLLKKIQDAKANTPQEISKVIANDAELKKFFKENQRKADELAMAKATKTSGLSPASVLKLSTVLGVGANMLTNPNTYALVTEAIRTGDNDTLSALGIDSSKVASARQFLQNELGTNSFPVGNQ